MLFCSEIFSTLRNVVFGSRAENSLRKKCVSFSYSHLGINIVSFNLKTHPGGCTLHKDRDISEANDEFLMCAALKTVIVQVFMKEKQKLHNVREDKTPLVHYVTFVFSHKDSNLISKLHT